MICNSSTGLCFCKPNVDPNVNTICDTCLDEYWNISSMNPNGCQGIYIHPIQLVLKEACDDEVVLYRMFM